MYLLNMGYAQHQQQNGVRISYLFFTISKLELHAQFQELILISIGKQWLCVDTQIECLSRGLLKIFKTLCDEIVHFQCVGESFFFFDGI